MHISTSNPSKTSKPPFLLTLLVTFGVGLAPKAPGTFGSLPAFLIAFLCFFFLGQNGYIALLAMIILLFVISLPATTAYMNLTGNHDPKEVVIDEVIGQLMVLFAVAPITEYVGHQSTEKWLLLLASFVSFRFFDIVKPWPISYIDQNVAGSLGVMLDDILAAIFAIIVLYVMAYGLGWLWF